MVLIKLLKGQGQVSYASPSFSFFAAGAYLCIRWSGHATEKERTREVIASVHESEQRQRELIC